MTSTRGSSKGTNELVIAVTNLIRELDFKVESHDDKLDKIITKVWVAYLNLILNFERGSNTDANIIYSLTSWNTK